MDYDICSYKIGKAMLYKGQYIEGIRKLKESQGSIIFDINNGFSIISKHLV